MSAPKRLTPENVRLIMVALRDGVASQRQLARIFGVTQAAISYIGSGASYPDMWREVNEGRSGDVSE